MATITLLKASAFDRVQEQLLSSTALGRILASTPAEPSLVLDFARGGYGSGDRSGITKVDTLADLVTFTRAGEATYWDADGVLQTAAVDMPRLDHDPATGAARGLLIEGASTNNLLRSADVDTAEWNGRSDFTITAATSVIAGQTARKLTNNGALGSRSITQIAGTLTGGDETLSVLYEADTAAEFDISLYDGTTSEHIYGITVTVADLSVAVMTGSGTHKVEDMGTGPNGGRLIRASRDGGRRGRKHPENVDLPDRQ